MEWNNDNILELINKQRAYFRSGETLDVNFRKQQLIKLKNAVIKYQDKLMEALYKDLGRSKVEAYFCDVASLILEINEAIKGVKKWAKPETHFSGLLAFPSLFTKVYKKPYGVTLIISPFNFPILLSLGVAVASISAGNTVIIKVSSKSKYCSGVIEELISNTFNEKYIKVVTGGHDVADLLLENRFDKIFYTGSPRVAHHILECASKHLTPVALELGGENGNWALVTKDSDYLDAARKIAFMKSLNSGQVCINVNQVAVSKSIVVPFLEALKNEFKRQLGNIPINNTEYPRLIDERAFDRCVNDLKDYKDKIIYGGEGDRGTLKFAPTILYPIDIDSDIVQKELFSPLLPIVVYDDNDLDKVIDKIESREHPLAFYLFTKNKKWAKRIMERMQFGGGCINEVCIHLMVKGVPFNGCGHSGMGAYHGVWGFREFSHPSTVLIGKNKMNLPLREHPYTEKKYKLIRKFEK